MTDPVSAVLQGSGANVAFHDYVAVRNSQLVRAHVDTEIQVLIS